VSPLRPRLSGMQGYMVVLFGQSVSQLGSGLSRFAIGIWIYQLTGSVTQFALATFFGIAPTVLLAPLVGNLVDRWDRRWAMILSDAGAGVGTLVLAFLMWSGKVELWHLYLVIASNAAFGTIQFPAFSAATTLLVPRERLNQANGLSTFGHSLVSLLAPLAAGFLIGTIELAGIILIDGATCLFAVLTLLVIRIPRPAQERLAEEAPRSFLAESLFGWRYIRARPGLLGLLLVFAAVNFATALVQTLITPLVLSFAPSAVLGTVVTGAGLGLLAGGILMSVWKGPDRKVRAILAVLAFQGVMLLCGGLRPNATLIAASAFLYLACVPVLNACSQTVWQSKIPPSMQGRVFSIRQMIPGATLPLGALMAGPLSDRVFEPLLAPGGALAGSVGRVLGTGPGRGIGFLFVSLGCLVFLTALAGSRQASLRNVETDLPDALPQEA
jgi:DHA3 family macrolide efflux protein-like MFS transporter